MVVTIKENLEAVLGLCTKYNVRTLEVFGSTVENETVWGVICGDLPVLTNEVSDLIG